MPSIIDDLFNALFRPGSRRCTLCMERCPTRVGEPLPDGWELAWSGVGGLYLHIAERGDEREVLCPSCAAFERKLKEQRDRDNVMGG
jgi:hypothetical protein